MLQLKIETRETLQLSTYKYCSEVIFGAFFCILVIGQFRRIGGNSHET